MGQQVGVAKAAHMLGVSRHDLQRLIHDGDLRTFEGQVDMDELRQRYPALALKDDPVMERIDLIRGTAFGRRVRETLMPDTDSLQIQLRNTHLPTNIVVQCQNDRSQHKNRAEAMSMLKSRLYEEELRKRNADLSVSQAKVLKFRGCIEELAQLLGDLNRDATPDQKKVITIINSWLLDKLER